ncbi:hypothetical protein CLAIMM_01313, partial [Cladophialophora immunda]
NDDAEESDGAATSKNNSKDSDAKKNKNQPRFIQKLKWKSWQDGDCASGSFLVPSRRRRRLGDATSSHDGNSGQSGKALEASGEGSMTGWSRVRWACGKSIEGNCAALAVCQWQIHVPPSESQRLIGPWKKPSPLRRPALESFGILVTARQADGFWGLQMDDGLAELQPWGGWGCLAGL